MKKLLLFACTVFIIPFITNYTAYYQYHTNTLRRSFSIESYKQQYNNGIYKYRILGTQLQFITYRLVTSHIDKLPSFVTSAFLQYADPRHLDAQANSLFYTSIFLLNTFFLIATIFSLMIFLQRHSIYSESINCMIANIVTFLIVFSQYVITPYDTLSYFLFILTVIFYIKPHRGMYVASMVIMCIATLTRETSFLSISLIWTLFFNRIDNSRMSIYKPLIMTLVVLVTYILLRVWLGWSQGFYHDIQIFNRSVLFQNFILATFFIVIASIFISVSPTPLHKKIKAEFFFYSLPYLGWILIVARLVEFRLFIPLLLGLILIQTMDLRSYKDQVHSH